MKTESEKFETTARSYLYVGQSKNVCKKNIFNFLNLKIHIFRPKFCFISSLKRNRSDP